MATTISHGDGPIVELENDEIIISEPRLHTLDEQLRGLVDRARYYGEHTDTLEVFEELQKMVGDIYVTAQ